MPVNAPFTSLTHPQHRRRRALGRLLVLVAVSGLTFLGGNLAFPQVNLRALLPLEERSAEQPAAPTRLGPDAIGKKLDRAERALRDQLDKKQRELEALERTLFLMELHDGSKEALRRLHKSNETTRREVDTLKQRVTEIQALRQQLLQADVHRHPNGQTGEQQELDELVIRAHHLLDSGMAHGTQTAFQMGTP